MKQIITLMGSVLLLSSATLAMEKLVVDDPKIDPPKGAVKAEDLKDNSTVEDLTVMKKGFLQASQELDTLISKKQGSATLGQLGEKAEAELLKTSEVLTKLSKSLHPEEFGDSKNQEGLFELYSSIVDGIKKFQVGGQVLFSSILAPIPSASDPSIVLVPGSKFTKLHAGYELEYKVDEESSVESFTLSNGVPTDLVHLSVPVSKEEMTTKKIPYLFFKDGSFIFFKDPKKIETSFKSKLQFRATVTPLIHGELKYEFGKTAQSIIKCVFPQGFLAPLSFIHTSLSSIEGDQLPLLQPIVENLGKTLATKIEFIGKQIEKSKTLAEPEEEGDLEHLKAFQEAFKILQGTLKPTSEKVEVKKKLGTGGKKFTFDGF